MAHLCTQGCWVNHIWVWFIEVNNQWLCLFCTWQALVHNVHLYVIYLLVWSFSCMCRKAVFAFRLKWKYFDKWFWWVLVRMMFSRLTVMHGTYFQQSWRVCTNEWTMCVSVCPFVRSFIFPSHFGGLCHLVYVWNKRISLHENIEIFYKVVWNRV